MPWSVSAKITKDNAVGQIQQLEPAGEIGEGARFQLTKAKEYVCDAIPSMCVRGENFTVNLSGHSQSDSPGSAPDSINISIYAQT